LKRAGCGGHIPAVARCLLTRYGYGYGYRPREAETPAVITAYESGFIR
jgi:hypothetical protein